MANDTGLTKLACKTAEKFLDALALWNAHWAGDYLPEEWLFRGHANAAWDLYPKAAWARTVLRPHEGSGLLPSADPYFQACAATSAPRAAIGTVTRTHL